MTQVLELARKPDHVPEELVFGFDFYNIPGADEDVHAAYLAVQQSAPDIFWTPHNGGHWVATRGEDVIAMQRNYRQFSHRRIVLPPMPEATPRQIPLEMDPPEHSSYRRPLTMALQPAIVREIDDEVRAVAIAAIEAVQSAGACEFIEDFAQVLPIHVFLKLVDLPVADKGLLLPLVEAATRSTTSEARNAAHEQMGTYLYGHIAARREAPGEDLLSKLVNVDIDGTRISVDEAIAYATLVLFGGLDTVAGMLGFIARFLAQNPGHRRQLAERLDDQPFIAAATEELIRRHGLANTARVITEDFEYRGIALRAGDRILPANLFVGLDDRLNPDPMSVDFTREKPIHAAFGNGPHACPGAILARREIRTFLEEWLSRIPDFSIKPGSRPLMATGMVNGLLKLELVWA